jgi:endonuclease YncB( thermonuclease family)
MMRYLLSGVLLVSCSIALAEEFDAKVIAVMDGDTVMVLRDGKKIKVRLANIDAPEADQEFGRESRQALADKVLKKQVHVNSQAVDSYGRIIAEISLDGQSVNEVQVNSGMAWEYSHFHRNKRYLSLNQQAQQSRRGLWAKNGQPISPEQWRKTHLAKSPSAKAASSAHVNTACGKKHLCSQMISCEEAKIYLLQCGVQTLDGNGDGVPCESLCPAVSLKTHQAHPALPVDHH